MAAQALVRHSYENPVETFQTNAIGTLNLLESVRVTGGVKALVNVTTDKCYENKEWIWPYRESEPLSGHDDWVNALAFSSDGRYLTSGSRNGSLILWSVSLESWQDRACKIANRDLHDSELMLYFRNADSHPVCAQ